MKRHITPEGDFIYGEKRENGKFDKDDYVIIDYKNGSRFEGKIKKKLFNGPNCYYRNTTGGFEYKGSYLKGLMDG